MFEVIYVKEQQKAGGFETTEAFNICVHNIGYGLGVGCYNEDGSSREFDESEFPEDARLSIECAREIMVLEPSQ